MAHSMGNYMFLLRNFCVGSLYLLLTGYRNRYIPFWSLSMLWRMVCLTWWFLYGGALSMVKVQLINRQSGSLLAEWIITIGLILLLISIALPIVTTPSRYTLNGATQEVAYMLKKVQLWSMLGHKSNGKGRMLFILNKDSYTLEEDVNHHTVNISLPQNIENERSMTIISFSALGLPYDGTEIILKDRESGEKNRIWISVQTGRIRWEEVH